MKHDPIVEEIHQIRQTMLAECHGELDQLLDRLQAAEAQDQIRMVSWNDFQDKQPSDPDRYRRFLDERSASTRRIPLEDIAAEIDRELVKQQQPPVPRMTS